MSAKKARKNKAASPTRFPRTRAALRAAPPVAADKGRSTDERMAQQVAAAAAPPEPADVPMAQAAAADDWADGAAVAAERAVAGAAPSEDTAPAGAGCAISSRRNTGRLPVGERKWPTCRQTVR